MTQKRSPSQGSGRPRTHVSLSRLPEPLRKCRAEKDDSLRGRVGAVAGRLPHVSMRGTLSRFNWRITLVQFLANAIVIGLLILLLPGVELHATHRVLAVLWLAAVFGVVTALARPALEF